MPDSIVECFRHDRASIVRRMAPLASPFTARGNSTACLRPALSNALILAATSSAVPAALRVKTISSLTARIAPNQTLRPPVSWAPALYRLCRCNPKASAWKMHANLADCTITASDNDLMDVRGEQFTDNRVASSIVRRDGNGLARFPTDGILRIDGRPGDRCGIPCYIKRLLRAHLASPAMADSRNALSPSQEPRKAVERRRRRSEILSQEPNRMIGGEIGEASGRALQERAPVSQRLIEPIEMRAQLIKQVRHRRHHCDGIDISTGELGSVFEKPLRQRVGSLRERDADSRAEGCLLGPPGKRVGRAAAGGIKARSWVPALEFAHDQLAVAIDVRANLQNRRLAIASRQRRQIRFRHDDGKVDRCPGKALEAKPGPNLLRIGRSVVMVQDDVGHGIVTSKRLIWSPNLTELNSRHCEFSLVPPMNSVTAAATGSGCSTITKCPARGISTTCTRSPN